MRSFPAISATKLQAAAYLLGVALFSISFLVFLNASISFVVTDVIGRKHGVGNVVGTLGFADELVALVACPLWGLLSDKVGVRNVTVTGYVIVGLSLMLLVQSHNVYPQLLIGRLAFSVGAAACSTMVTAILPTMTAEKKQATSTESLQPHAETPPISTNNIRHSGSFSISSELTITPARYTSRPPNQRRRSQKLRFQSERQPASKSSVSQLAGFVGMFTGIGALLAVSVFLPLPVKFSGDGTSQADAVKDSFYVVGTIAIVVSVFLFFGLRRLPGEENKGFRKLLPVGFTRWNTAHEQDQSADDAAASHRTLSYYQLVKSALLLGFTDTEIALGYLGGFVARASSVGISLFIPLFVNAYFIREGLCTDDHSEEMKQNCRSAYTLASMLTGFSQLTALICAPLFGWFNGKMSEKGQLAYLPLGLGAVSGIIGCIAFGMLNNPDPFHENPNTKSNGKWAILAVILLGFGQISAIVCSLGILSRGIQNPGPTQNQPESPFVSRNASIGHEIVDETGLSPAPETALLLPPIEEPRPETFEEADRAQLKGTIAGVYSLAGGAGILLLTKLGGVLFDEQSPGAPFYMLAGFNGILLFAIVAISAGQKIRNFKSDT